MIAAFRSFFDIHGPSSPWHDTAPVREELFGLERLEEHAASLAAAQRITATPPAVLSLRTRLDRNAAVLLAAYRSNAAALEGGGSVAPAAEWLLDNYHIVEEQIREIRDDLPPGYYRQLPKLAEGPFAGYPRVFGMAWAFVAHTDSHFDPEILRRFIVAYQRIQPLTIGELWAIAITLRIVLVENLRRLADQITTGQRVRAEADALADRLLAPGNSRSAFDAELAGHSSSPLSERFAAQLAKRLRDQDPRTMPALGWLERQLRSQDLTIGEVVDHAQQRQGASNVTVRNVITSMRLISNIDWAELVESVSLVDERLRGSSDFAAMDFTTRDLYRKAVEQLARHSSHSELAVVDHTLMAVQRTVTDPADIAGIEQMADPGYHLIGAGRPALERKVGFRPPVRLWISRFSIRLGLPGYAGAILLTTLVLLGFAVGVMASYGLSAGRLAAFAALGFIPATEVAATLVNRAVTWTFGAIVLPGLELKTGVPASLRTLVVVPTLLTSESDLLEQIERLEIHHLSGAGGDLSFALLSDGVDADEGTLPGDAHLLATAVAAISALNHKHGPGPSGNRFHFLHRRRVFNAGEGKWMGWERKRGKIDELNQLLRGSTGTTFMTTAGCAPQLPDNIRYVITLDADTRLPRDAALRLIGKMAHPLNRPKFDAAGQRVVSGYGILQPRVTPSLPVGREGSLYQRIFSSPGGIDPYAAAVSDVYQDLFGEGSYTGKGIYDVDAFHAALAGRVPENTVLSHDLFEGVFARAGLVSDIEVIEDFPSRYDVIANRQHRWTRGDWQLAPWVFGTRRGQSGLTGIGRWKMLDNLRRSLLAPLTVLLVCLCGLLPLQAGLGGLGFALAAMAVPVFLPVAFALLPHRSGTRLRSHIGAAVSDLRDATLRILLSVAFLADQAWRMIDAIGRTLVRLLVTRRHLLEWTTAAEAAGRPRLTLRGFYRRMSGGLLLSLIFGSGALILAPSSWPLVLPVVVVWWAAPALALWVSRSPPPLRRLAITAAEARGLRLIARRTWRYFEVFVTPAENMLPPDNFQEDPKPVVAHRTSPTNIGLYLLSAVAARDFGWAGTLETVDRLEAALASMRQLPRFRGHFLNWYDTQTLRALDPAYVSSVDSGNLAGHLIVLANACEEWIGGGPAAQARSGMADDLLLARAAFAALPAGRGEKGRQFAMILDEIDGQLKGGLTTSALYPALKRLVERAARSAQGIVAADGEAESQDLMLWLDILRKAVAEHDRDRLQYAGTTQDLNDRLTVIAAAAREMALAMDFAFLLDPERKLLSIGYSVAGSSLDPSCYDLLASEARLASLFAIAKGDVETQHWFRLGRTSTPLGDGAALISWSGSMFEYLMPSLVMRAPAGSLLERTNTLVVERQRRYGQGLGTPWGVSESAYNARDMEFTYQYSNFGVPGLGLKRGLAENVVIAPYATGLAAMVDPRRALRNYTRLAEMGARGRYGFYEALDFTRSRLPENRSVEIVRSFMAHHQGMTIVAIANTLHDAGMRTRFHREPMIQASELLLQERMPRGVAVAHPRAEEVRVSATETRAEVETVRRIRVSAGDRPDTHLLSNGRYAVMLTSAGGGYSRWRDMYITRWREDVTCDDWGSFVFIRDVQSGRQWSTGARPAGQGGEENAVVFGEDYAEFTHRDGALTTTMDVLVSDEDDGEVRRVSLANSGRRAREVDVTSYAELVLTTAAADTAHPAFSKMFVQTEYLAEFGALIATRRPRSQDEPQIWAAHFAVVEGDATVDPQYESDRMRFIGRGRGLGTAAALAQGAVLSNTVGTVLDPVFSLRHRLAILPGKVARIAFWTVVASSRAALLDLIDMHHDRNAFDRAKTLAWTQAQVQLRHLDIEAEEAADFQRLATPILYADPRFRAPPDAIARGAGPQSGLWPQGISGDLPIILLRIDEIEDIAQVRQLLRAQEYWRLKRLSVDLVIVNERASSYTQDLQNAIETAVRSSQTRPRFGGELAHGAVYTLRADLISGETRALLQSIARVALIARRGSIATQLARLPVAAPDGAPAQPRREAAPAPPPPALTAPDPSMLEFFNGLGGFDRDGREYVTILGAGQTTPAPWLNVIANPAFGFQVSAEGSGYTWAENSRENQLTPWSNDPVRDPAAEAMYIRDEASGDIWTPTAQPIRDTGVYTARHGFGYSRFEHEAGGLAFDLLQYVPLADPVKISRLTLRNRSGRARRLSVTAYAEWVLGTSRGASGPFVITEIDDATGAMLACNPWSTGFPGRIAFADLGGRQTAWTADRLEFLGRGGAISAPAGLTGTAPLSGATGAGLDPCAALQDVVDLEDGAEVEIVWLMGQCRSAAEARRLVLHYRGADLDAALDAVTSHWCKVLGAVQVRTPDRAMDIMLNGWLLYQTIACRVWARSAFYQASGAYGFRDQLQDGMALTFAAPEETRLHLLRAASRQFVEGDVQHWWLPQSGLGVRTRISDDRVWLAYTTATYVATSGDAAVLDESARFIEGPLLGVGEHDAFFQPMIADESASLFEHCARGIDQCIALAGQHGLPLIGTGDWNDGLNRVGQDGRGESVWLGWLLLRTITLFAPLADTRGDTGRVKRWQTHAKALQAAVERVAWDGAWYRRATFDDGTWLGSKDSGECRIDSIAQSWAVLSGAADPVRAATAMASLRQHLIRDGDGLALLFTPPFDTTPRDPGYIKGYPPGLRENGGQYSHAAMWAILAFAKLGQGQAATELFALLNPINHASTSAAAERYKVEPYVVAADVYSVAPHVGRGGWTWYTGAAGWMYRAGLEGILGIRREGDMLIVKPCLPEDWPGFEATLSIGSGRYDIRVSQSLADDEDGGHAVLDGVRIECAGRGFEVPLDGGEHSLLISI